MIHAAIIKYFNMMGESHAVPASSYFLNSVEGLFFFGYVPKWRRLRPSTYGASPLRSGRGRRAVKRSAILV